MTDNIRPLNQRIKLLCELTQRTASNLKLLHQLADGFAAGADDASVGPRVEVNVLAHHLLPLSHQLLDRLTSLLHIALVPRDHDQILWSGRQGREDSY